MVKNGIDCLDKNENVFKKKRLGLITSVSGVDQKLCSSIELLHKKFGLSALFSPEHGVRGNVGAGGEVESYTDPYTGLPVYSLYRKDSKRLTPKMLQTVDAVVYDIQDLGVRYYTYISTMIYAMEECAAQHKELIILDRLNPLGLKAEGNMIKPGYESFVGAYPLCMRYGLTAGELAGMVKKERSLDVELTIIPCEHWDPSDLFPETGNIWVMPSPGIPRFETALLYPGTCLFEGTNISEGRGTAAPFEIIGAPFIDAIHLVEKMTEKKLPGVLFSPAYFIPSFSKYQGEECQGAHIHITDAKSYQPVEAGLELIFTIKEMYGEYFRFLPPQKEGGRSFIELLYGSNEIILPDVTKEMLMEQMQNEAKEFEERSREFHMYCSRRCRRPDGKVGEK